MLDVGGVADDSAAPVRRERGRRGRAAQARGAPPGLFYFTHYRGRVLYTNPAFFQDLAQLLAYELTHVRASPGDCAAGWARIFFSLKAVKHLYGKCHCLSGRTPLAHAVG